MAFDGIKIVKSYFVPGLAVAGLAWGVNWLFANVIPKINISFATIDVGGKISQGVGNGVGAKILGLFNLSGVPQPDWLMLLVGGVLATLFGALLLAGGFPAFNKSPFWQWVSILFYGSLVATMITSTSFGILVFWNTWAVLAALFIYSMIIAFVLMLFYDHVMPNSMPQLPQ